MTTTQDFSAEPDLGALRESSEGLIVQMSRFANMATMLTQTVTELRMELRGEMTQLRGEITETRGEVTQLRGEVTQLRGDMTRGMSTMQTEIRILNRNVTSRLGNNIMVNGDDRLEPLYNLTTGEIIANCPATLGELEQCSAARITALLRELDEVVPRSLEDKRRRLRLAFGQKSLRDLL
ncbi:hypothetical protein E4U54_002365 [Claviceps lovelessii]|nr:hypothetical protein E4U54_002365 [Claviceps lovelessii]